MPVFNLIMALVISAVIVIIAVVKNPVAKALVYSLPIPITMALIASQKQVDGSHIIGLFILTGFLWLVGLFYQRGAPILVADVLAALVYVSIGYLALKVEGGQESFFLLAGAYGLFWVVFMKLYRFKPANTVLGKQVNILFKGAIVFFIALALLMAKDVLRGVVVTFPFSGVFTVFEMRDNLETLAAQWTKNSLAVVAFFIIVHLLAGLAGFYPSIALGWGGYLLTLKLVRRIK